jgi:hypothetical protein
MLPDLRSSPAINTAQLWQSIVLGGALSDRGMVSFAAELDEAAAESVRAYLIARAHESIALAAPQATTD